MEPLLGGRLSKLNDNLVARLKQRRPESSVASWAFRFAGSFPDILTVLSGMTYMEHLQDNLRTYSPLEPLTDEEMDFLEDTAQLMLKYPTIPCNDCKYCMPCPYGLDIPATLLHYNRCVNEGNVPKTGRMRIMSKPVVPSSSDMTVVYLNSGRQVIVSDAINVYRIVRKISIYPKNCIG